MVKVTSSSTAEIRAGSSNPDSPSSCHRANRSHGSPSSRVPSVATTNALPIHAASPRIVTWLSIRLPRGSSRSVSFAPTPLSCMWRRDRDARRSDFSPRALKVGRDLKLVCVCSRWIGDADACGPGVGASPTDASHRGRRCAGAGGPSESSREGSVQSGSALALPDASRSLSASIRSGRPAPDIPSSSGQNVSPPASRNAPRPHVENEPDGGR